MDVNNCQNSSNCIATICAFYCMQKNNKNSQNDFNKHLLSNNNNLRNFNYNLYQKLLKNEEEILKLVQALDEEALKYTKQKS